MKRWLREPLLHFVALGAFLFVLDDILSEREVEAGEKQIVVTEGRIENLAALFAKTWQRPPTAKELQGLVNDYVLEEALYREGVALGVDRDDTIIRRRVRQKMEFIADDIIEAAEPTAEELAAWFAAHRESYALPMRFRFRQVYLNPDRRGEKLRSDAQRVLAELRAMDAGADPRGLGDLTLLQHAFKDAGADVVARTFGKDFADRLAVVPTTEWSGPLESPFGLHLVIVDHLVQARIPALDEVRAAVERDCMHDRHEKASKQFHEAIVKRYHLVIEWPVELRADTREKAPSESGREQE